MRNLHGHDDMVISAAGAAAVVLLAGCAAVPRANEVGFEALERERFAAMTRQDVAALRPMLATDLRYCHSTGRCETREQFLATIAAGTIRYRTIEPRGMRVRRFGTLVLIDGRAGIDGLADGRPVSMQIVYLDAYEWREGHWQLVAWQSTRAP